MLLKTSGLITCGLKKCKDKREKEHLHCWYFNEKYHKKVIRKIAQNVPFSYLLENLSSFKISQEKGE